MLDSETLKLLVPLGVGGLLAGMIFMFYRKDALAWQEAWKGQSENLLEVVKDNTQAMTALKEQFLSEREWERRQDRRP